MAVSKDDFDRWIKTAIKNKCIYIISVCDTFDWDDYPVYCKDKEELKTHFTLKGISYQYNGITNMQKVNEIIMIINGEAIENLRIEDIL